LDIAVVIDTTRFIQRLGHAKPMSFHFKGISINHVLPSTRRIFIFHPMQVNTFILVLVEGNATISLEVNGRLMVTIAGATGGTRFTFGTRLARIDIDIPTASQFPMVSIPQLYV
jgi:hypothetical protein